MTRAEFIKNCTVLGLGMPFMSMLLQACGEDPIVNPDFETNFQGKVLVIGAGSAGLTAGYLLERHHIDFQILEASSIYGGRVRRLENFVDFPIDIGAEWLHDEPTALARMLQNPDVDAQIELVTYQPQTFQIWNNGKLQNQNWMRNFYSEYKFKNTTWFGFFENYMVPSIRDKILTDSKTFYDVAFRKDTERHVLGLFVINEEATPYTSLPTDQQTFERVLSELDKIFDGKASENYIQHFVQNWSKEPYIRGSYSTDFNDGCESTMNTISAPLDNKIYFAGEYLSSENQATVHGASETAYQAVERLLKS